MRTTGGQRRSVTNQLPSKQGRQTLSQCSVQEQCSSHPVSAPVQGSRPQAAAHPAPGWPSASPRPQQARRPAARRTASCQRPCPARAAARRVAPPAAPCTCTGSSSDTHNPTHNTLTQQPQSASSCRRQRQPQVWSAAQAGAGSTKRSSYAPSKPFQQVCQPVSQQASESGLTCGRPWRPLMPPASPVAACRPAAPAGQSP